MIRRNCCFGISLITALLVIIGVIISGNDVLAKVSVNLPQTPGLYVADYIDWDDDKIMTDTDENGNTFLINHDSKVIPWRDQNNSDYLTKGMEADDPEEYWGQGFENGQEVWFDYIANGKVTHVNTEDIIITNLDGTDCGNDLLIEADNRDERVCRFTMNVPYKKVIITYKNDDDLANCKFVAEFALRTGFYTSDETKLDTLIMDEPVVLRGKSKDIYFHMTDVWEEDGFELFEKDPVSIRYWDRAQNKEVELTGDKVNDYITLTKISGENEKHHVIYKLTVNGIDSVDDGYNITVNFNRFNINSPNDKNKEDRQKFVKVRDTDILYAAGPEFLTVNGDQYTYSENAEYRKNGYFSAGSLYRPIYIDLKYCNDNGDMQPVKDLTKLSFYLSRWNEEEKKAILTKVGSDVIKAEKPYVDSDIIMVSYVGDTTKDDNKWNEFIVAYGDEVPAGTDMDSAIELSFVSSDFNELGTYKSNEINESTYAKEFETDGTADINIYAASLDLKEATPWNYVESAKISSVILTDENGKDLSSKVKFNSVALSSNEKPAIVYSEMVTIPKGTLTSSAKLRINVTANCNHWSNPEANERVVTPENYSLDVYILFTPHTHKAGKEWKKDNVNHWHECVAGDGTIYDKAAHSWDNGVVTAQPTTDKEGVKTYTCSVCNATKTEKIDKLPVQSTDTQKTTEVTQIVQVKEGDTKVDDKGASYTVTETSETGKTEVEYSAPDKTDSKVIIPETVDINGKIATVTSVADNAFSGNKTVTEIVLPSSIEVIGNNSFKNCSKLKNITLTNKVETIGTGAFSGCTSLKKIIISKNVRVIGKNAFSGAKKLKTITLKGNKIKTIGKNAFKNIPKTTTITIPKKAKKSYTKMLKKAGFKGKIKVK